MPGRFFVRMLSSFFGLGYAPFIPGTFGSLGGLALWYAVRHDIVLQCATLVVVASIGFAVSGRMEKLIHKKDPSVVVIDEVAGILITLIAIPLSLKAVFLGFILFRILDTTKPYPAGKIQYCHGSFGIMGDDIVAGIYANLVLRCILALSIV